MRAGRRSATAVAFALAFAGAARAQAPFYQGKTIYMVVGYAAGGGYDNYARLVSRHLADHIPGKPTVVVQNMPGAASLAAANYVYAVAPKDGTVIAATDQNIPLLQLLNGKGVRFDVGRFNWLGSVAASNGIAMTWGATGLKTLADVKTRTVTMGTTGPSDDAFIYAKSMNALLGTRFQPVQGYSGTSGVNIALENGEVEAMGRSTYYGFRSQREDWLRDGKVNLFVQFGLTKQPELEGVPTLIDVAATPEDKAFAELVSIPPSIGYAQWLAPGAPEDRIATLRKAFADTMTDPAFLEDAKAGKMEVRAQTGAQVAATIAAAGAIPQAVRDRAAGVFGWE